MGFVFVRQNGKVFGPFADDRLQAAIAAGKFDASAEFASNWDGPWGPSPNLQPVPVATQPAPIRASSNHPPAQSLNRQVTSQTSQVDVAGGDEEDGHSFFGFTVAPNGTVRIELPGQNIDHADDDDEKFFGGLTAATQSSAPSRRDRLPFSLPLAIGAGGVVLVAGVALIAAIVILGGGSQASSKPQAEDSRGSAVARSDRPLPATASRPRPVAVPRQRENDDAPASPAGRGGAPPGVAAVRSGTFQQSSDSPPSPAKPPADMPAEADEAVKSLRSLRASIDIGISFEQYSGKLQSLLPPVKLFLESRDAQRVPELAVSLTNASDCYVAVKRIWNDSIFEASPSAKAEATALLADTRTRLWEIADTNVQIAYELTSPELEVRSKAVARAAADSASLRADPVIDAARRAFADRRPVPAAPAAIRPAPKSTFNSENIDVRALRNLAETLKQGELAGEDLELVDQVLALTRSREWQTRQGDKSWGDAITIRPDTVRLITKKGDGTIPRERVSEAGQKVLQRIVELAEKLHSLSNRPAAAPPPSAP